MSDTITTTTETDSSVGISDQLTGVWKLAFQVPAVSLGFFALWSAGPGIAEDHIHLGFYTLVTWVLALLVFPAAKHMSWVAPGIKTLGVAAGLIGLITLLILRLDLLAGQGPSLLDIAIISGVIIGLALLVRFPRAIDFILMGLACLSIGYFIWEYRSLIDRAGAWTKTDFGMGVAATIVALEVARRTLGLWIPSIAIFAMLYAYFGEKTRC